MSLSPIKKFLLTYTPHQESVRYDVRDVVNKVFLQNNIPPLTEDEKVFIRSQDIVFSSCTSVRAYEVYRIQKQLIAELMKKTKQQQELIGVRFL